MKALRHDPFPGNPTFQGIYSHAVETRPDMRLLHVSGQVGTDENGVAPPDFEGQCRIALQKLETVLRSADMAFPDIIKMGFFLVRPEDMQTLVTLRKEYLDGVRPAVTTLYVAGLVAPDWLVEIEAIAAAPLSHS
ncbi:MAG: RidA family protein [Pseudomonadota bacterium]